MTPLKSVLPCTPLFDKTEDSLFLGYQLGTTPGAPEHTQGISGIASLFGIPEDHTWTMQTGDFTYTKVPGPIDLSKVALIKQTEFPNEGVTTLLVDAKAHTFVEQQKSMRTTILAVDKHKPLTAAWCKDSFSVATKDEAETTRLTQLYTAMLHGDIAIGVWAQTDTGYISPVIIIHSRLPHKMQPAQ